MAEVRKAKLFENGSSQAVMLPEEFRFAGDEVFISRDEQNNIVLSGEPDPILPGAGVWEEFFAFRDKVDIPEDWMTDRPLNCISPERPPLFSEDD